MIALHLIAEVADADTPAAARAALDRFRESVLPATEHGIVLFEPEPTPPVIIKLNNAEASIVSQPQKAILIDLDDLKETSDSSAALDLIDQITAANLPPEQAAALIAEITIAAEYICTRCDTPIPLGKDESTPAGSMHDQCAYDYEQEHPEEF